MTGHLRHFELGYDRAYIGIGLHCLLCEAAELIDHYEETVPVDDGESLADVAQAALDHLASRHPAIEP